MLEVYNIQQELPTLLDARFNTLRSGNGVYNIQQELLTLLDARFNTLRSGNGVYNIQKELPTLLDARFNTLRSGNGVYNIQQELLTLLDARFNTLRSGNGGREATFIVSSSALSVTSLSSTISVISRDKAVKSSVSVKIIINRVPFY